MGEEGAGWVRDRFSDQRLADDLTALYDMLLARKGVDIARVANPSPSVEQRDDSTAATAAETIGNRSVG
jgi:hypothetical protein